MAAAPNTTTVRQVITGLSPFPCAPTSNTATSHPILNSEVEPDLDVALNQAATTMGGERGDAGFSATSKSGSTSLFNIGWLVAVLEVGAHGKGDKPVMTWRTVVVLGPAAITIEDKRARDTPDTSQEIVVFLCTIVSPR